MTTRQEINNCRPLDFSKWIRKCLPDSATGFCVADLDWVIWNTRTRQLMLLEEKTRCADVAPWFRILIKTVIHPALREYCPKNNIRYYGFHLIQFENTCPTNGRIRFDYKDVTEEQLKNILSFRPF